ncbi:MAG: L,D-transpeptidase [Puniceicoccales bacterium]|jgi:hypothetical protein|nr:L,D-transpeptidase [Puniceicoccales bacterium]
MPFEKETALRLLDELETRRRELRLEEQKDYLCISICEQKLWHFREASLAFSCRVSTSRAAPSCIPGSFGTPTGLHRVAERIGDGEPCGTVFKGRLSQGFTWENSPQTVCTENLITTRILWLDGLEVGKNRGPGCDTHSRCVYIHGTNQEVAIGRPNSHGCVLLGNADMLSLYDTVPRGSLVWISLG